MIFSFAFFIQMATAAVTFVEGVVDQVVPLVHKIFPSSSAAAQNPNCEPPYCGVASHYCPEDQLAKACLEQRRQQQMAQATSRQLPASTVPPAKNDDEDSDSKDKSSSGSTVTLVIVGVVALAIAGFLYVRCMRRSPSGGNMDERKSTSWDV